MRKKRLKLLLACLILSIITIVIIVVFFRPMSINGDSMSPTYRHGEVIFTNTTTKNIEVGDIIVFYYGELKLIKRVVGMPNDTITIKDSSMYVNGDLIYISEKAIEDSKVILGNDEFYVLGDNRENSQDSRLLGKIKKRNIIGKVWFPKGIFRKE
ncbi:MAG: signal peptidase I [Christensenellaceae bacterium]|jgi:signal peptidase I|nr:signal peptidase I [Christensenellaceae bacterium]